MIMMMMMMIIIIIMTVIIISFPRILNVKLSFCFMMAPLTIIIMINIAISITTTFVVNVIMMSLQLTSNKQLRSLDPHFRAGLLTPSQSSMGR